MKKLWSKFLVVVVFLVGSVFDKIYGQGQQTFYGVEPVSVDPVVSVPLVETIFDVFFHYLLLPVVFIIGVIQFIRYKRAKTLDVKKFLLKFGAVLLGCGVMYGIYRLVLWYL